MHRLFCCVDELAFDDSVVGAFASASASSVMQCRKKTTPFGFFLMRNTWLWLRSSSRLIMNPLKILMPISTGLTRPRKTTRTTRMRSRSRAAVLWILVTSLKETAEDWLCQNAKIPIAFMACLVYNGRVDNYDWPKGDFLVCKKIIWTR